MIEEFTVYIVYLDDRNDFALHIIVMDLDLLSGESIGT